jgi:hypothetical protein
VLNADASAEGPGLTDQDVASALDMRVATVHRVRQAYVEHCLQEALSRKPAIRHRPRKLDGKGEARLVAIVCSPFLGAESGLVNVDERFSLKDNATAVAWGNALQSENYPGHLQPFRLVDHLSSPWVHYLLAL